MAECSFKFISPQNSQLIRQVQRAVTDNKKIHAQILGLDPKFTHKLYEPIKYEGINQMFLKPLILRQIDQLLEQKQFLLTKKQMLNFRANEQKSKKQQVVNENASSYSFLRNTWTRLPSISADSSERIDNLSKIVGAIKNGIKKMTQNQQIGINIQVSSAQQGVSYLASIAAQKLKQETQRYRMRNQELQTKCQQLGKIIDQKSKKIQILQHELYKAGNKIKQSIQALHATGQKLQTLKKVKQNLENEVQKLQLAKNKENEEANTKFLVFNSELQNFKVKIEADIIIQIKFEQTQKSLEQIVQFLRPKIQPCTFESVYISGDFSTNPELQIPYLSSKYTQSSQLSTLSDRRLPQAPKFIPLRSQRLCKVEDQMQNINDIGSQGQDCEKKHTQHNQNSNLRFSRKIGMPLNTDRLRKTKKY